MGEDTRPEVSPTVSILTDERVYKSTWKACYKSADDEQEWLQAALIKRYQTILSKILDIWLVLSHAQNQYWARQ